jgi:hypothetical protein
MIMVSGVSVLAAGFSFLAAGQGPDTLYETPPGRNSEQIERRTLNVQHPTSNIDDATLYRF